MAKCSLCGGDLDRNKRCTLCGLDNTKNDSMYRHMINQNDCADEPLTHVHEHPKEEEWKTRVNTYTSKANRKTYSKPTYSSGTRKTKKNKKVSVVLIIFIIICLVNTIFGIMTAILSSVSNDYSNDFWDGEIVEEEWNIDNDWEDMYQFVVDDMPEEGEEYRVFLEPGIYLVGAHIPKGIYEVWVTDGENGHLAVNDYNNAIYTSIDLDYQDGTYIEDLRLYDGALLTISSGITVELTTFNAQPLTIEAQENSVTESYELEGSAVVGEDFPAGIYHVKFNTDRDSYGELYCNVNYETEYGDGYTYLNILFSREAGDEVYHNLVLTEGTKLGLSYIETATLIPVSEVYVADYDIFYENYICY